MKSFKGTGVALVTPFHKDGSIDFKSLAKLINSVIQGGIDYVVPLGTTGESVTLTREEKTAITGFVTKTVDQRVPVVLGLGGNNTQEIITCLKSTDFDGIDAILSVSPYYNKPAQSGLFEHYKRIAETSPVPVILYNIPGRTSSNLTAETTLRIAEVENIIGIKEASGNLSQCMQIIKNRPEGFLVISGDDALTLPLIALGADGVISVVANAFPAKFSELVKFALNGDFKNAREIHYLLLDVTEKLFIEGNPSGIKAALEILGVCSNYLRLPLVPVSKNNYQALSEGIKEIKKELRASLKTKKFEADESGKAQFTHSK